MAKKKPVHVEIWSAEESGGGPNWKAKSERWVSSQWEVEGRDPVTICADAEKGISVWYGDDMGRNGKWIPIPATKAELFKIFAEMVQDELRADGEWQ